MKYIDDFDQRIKRYEAFWAGEMIDRCCLSVVAPKRKIQPESLPTNPDDLLSYWTDAERVMKRDIQKLENSYFAGDSLPMNYFNLGACGHAAYFRGAQYAFHDSLWFTPSIHDLASEIPVFDENSFLYRKTIEMARYFTDECKGDYLLANPDNAGCLDALAHLRGTENLLVDMMEDESAVQAALASIQAGWERVTSEIFDIFRRNNNGASCIGWLRTYAPGRHAQLQCDISAMISPPMFETYCLPELRKQSASLDYALYHLDGQEQIRHLDLILSAEKIKAIQWTCVDGQPSPLEFIPTLQKIQAAGKGLCIITHPHELEGLLAALSSRGLYLIVDAASPEEADRMVKMANKLSHK